MGYDFIRKTAIAAANVLDFKVTDTVLLGEGAMLSEDSGKAECSTKRNNTQSHSAVETRSVVRHPEGR